MAASGNDFAVSRLQLSRERWQRPRLPGSRLPEPSTTPLRPNWLQLSLLRLRESTLSSTDPPTRKL